jgi:hypothetical protein
MGRCIIHAFGKLESRQSVRAVAVFLQLDALGERGTSGGFPFRITQLGRRDTGVRNALGLLRLRDR